MGWYPYPLRLYRNDPYLPERSHDDGEVQGARERGGCVVCFLKLIYSSSHD